MLQQGYKQYGDDKSIIHFLRVLNFEKRNHNGFAVFIYFNSMAIEVSRRTFPIVVCKAELFLWYAYQVGVEFFVPIGILVY
jgi:hypothetical protein